jgi:hypothetical protein
MLCHRNKLKFRYFLSRADEDLICDLSVIRDLTASNLSPKILFYGLFLITKLRKLNSPRIVRNSAGCVTAHRRFTLWLKETKQKQKQNCIEQDPVQLGQPLTRSRNYPASNTAGNYEVVRFARVGLIIYYSLEIHDLGPFISFSI